MAACAWRDHGCGARVRPGGRRCLGRDFVDDAGRAAAGCRVVRLAQLAVGRASQKAARPADLKFLQRSAISSRNFSTLRPAAYGWCRLTSPTAIGSLCAGTGGSLIRVPPCPSPADLKLAWIY